MGFHSQGRQELRPSTQPDPPLLVSSGWKAQVSLLLPEEALRAKECRLCLQQCVEGPCRATVWESPPISTSYNPTPSGEEEKEKPDCRLEGGLLECASGGKNFCMERIRRKDSIGQYNSKKEMVGLGILEQGWSRSRTRTLSHWSRSQTFTEPVTFQKLQ